jgi:hypothetical protein
MYTTRLYVYMYSIIIIMILLNLCMDGKGVCCDGWIFSFSYTYKAIVTQGRVFHFLEREFVWLVDDREDLMRPWETTLLASSSSYCCVL